MHAPEGWEQGLPRVTVSDATVRFLGKPTVNYALLEEFFREGFDLPEGLTPTVRIYGSSPYQAYSLVRGTYPPFSTTIAANAPRAIAKHGPNGVMRTVARFTQGVSDCYDHLARMACEAGQRAVIAKTGALAILGCADIVVPHLAPLVAIAAAPGAALTYRKTISPAHRRRRAAEHDDELFAHYGSAITFGSDAAVIFSRRLANKLEITEEDMV